MNRFRYVTREYIDANCHIRYSVVDTWSGEIIETVDNRKTADSLKFHMNRQLEMFERKYRKLPVEMKDGKWPDR